MNFDSVSRKQEAVLWRAVGYDAKGDVKVSAAERVTEVRWESARRETVTAESEPLAYDATLYCSIEIGVGSLVWEGKFKDLPDAPTNVHEVIGSDKSPGPQNKTVNRSYQLRRWKDSYIPLAS